MVLSKIAPCSKEPSIQDDGIVWFEEHLAFNSVPSFDFIPHVWCSLVPTIHYPPFTEVGGACVIFFVTDDVSFRAVSEATRLGDVD